MAIPGLMYIAGYIADQDETALLAAVDAEPWLAARLVADSRY
jgi:hypothetical protein